MAKGDDETPSALLSKTQRENLVAEELPGSTRWSMSSRIRDRLEATVYDFALLYDNCDRINLDKVVGQDRENEREFEKALVAMIATVYRLSYPNANFRQLLKRGVMMAERDHNNRIVHPRFRLNGTDSPAVGTARLADRIEQFEREENAPDIRVGELRLLAEAIAHSDVNVAKAVRQGNSRMFNVDTEPAADELVNKKHGDD
jgi:hypothetical protein